MKPKSLRCTYAENNVLFGDNMKFRPCCRFEPHGDYPLPSKKMFSMNEAFNHETFQKVREELRAGNFPPTCVVCKNEEEAGLTSLRPRLGYEIPNLSADQGLQGIELFIGSLCNMKCRMCDEHSSSKWAEEKKVHLPENASPDLDPILSGLDCTEVKSIRMLGGETLINQNFAKVLRKFAKEGKPEQIRISFATNGSVRPSERILDLLLPFKEVEIDFSVDGIGGVGEYIRHGYSWEKVDLCIQEWVKVRDRYRESGRDFLQLNVHTTIQAANYSELGNILAYCLDRRIRSWSHRTLNFPEDLSVEHLPRELRQSLALDLLNHPRRAEMEESLGSVFRSGGWKYITEEIPLLPEEPAQAFIEALERDDRRWGVSWLKALPALRSLAKVKFMKSPSEHVIVADQNLKTSFHDWIEKRVSRRSQSLNGLPVCPFAREAVLNQEVALYELNAPSLSQALREICLQFEKFEKKVVVLWVEEEMISAQETEEMMAQIRREFGPKNIWVMYDHPQIQEEVQGLDLSFGKGLLFFVQPLSELVDKSRFLESLGYYKNWSPEYFDQVVGVRDRMHEELLRSPANSEQALSND